MQDVTQVINGLAQLMAILAGTHLIVKFVPIKWLAYVDNNLIPLVGAIAAFLGPLKGLSGAPTTISLLLASPAYAGVVPAEVTVQLGMAAKAGLAGLVTIAGSLIHEHILRIAYKKLGLKKYEGVKEVQ